jgi:hypothetical protein
MVVGEQQGCLLVRHAAPPTCCGTPAGGFLRLASPHGIRWWPLPGRWLPRLPTCGGSWRGAPASTADRARPASSTRGRRSLQSRTASAWFSASTAATNSWSRLRICPARFLLRSSDARPAWRSHRPMRSITPVRRGGHDRARCLAVSAVRTGGSRVLVVVGVSRSSAAASASQAGFLRDLPDQYRGDQRGNQHDQQDPGPPDSPAAGSAAADGVEVEVAGSAAADVGGSTDVGGRVVAGGSAVVRVGRVVGVAVSLGDSVTLGAGRVPERSVKVRVDEMLPSSTATTEQQSQPHRRITSGPTGQLGTMSRRGGAHCSAGIPPQHHP